MPMPMPHFTSLQWRFVHVEKRKLTRQKSITQRRANEINAQLEAQHQAKESAELECSAYAHLIGKRAP